MTDPSVILSSHSGWILIYTSIFYRGTPQGLLGLIISNKAGSRHKPLFEVTPMGNFLYNAILGKSCLFSKEHYGFSPSL